MRNSSRKKQQGLWEGFHQEEKLISFSLVGETLEKKIFIHIPALIGLIRINISNDCYSETKR